MTQMLNATHQTPTFGPVPRSRIRPWVRRSLIVTLAAGALISSAYAPAYAEDTPAQQVTANVEVGSTILLTGLDASFTMGGLPGDFVSADVAYTVKTNNVAGYTVSVQSQSTDLIGTGGNSDVIPVSDVGAGDITSVGALAGPGDTPTQVHYQSNRSIPDGDALSTHFELTIPFVNSDTYTATLDYVATTL